MKRRQFIQQSTAATTLVGLGGLGLQSFNSPQTKKITILPSFEILLTGGPAKPEGKAWRLKAAYTAGIEGASGVENSLSIFQ